MEQKLDWELVLKRRREIDNILQELDLSSKRSMELTRDIILSGTVFGRGMLTALIERKETK